MSLDFQTVDVKFTQGLDTKTQSKLVVPGKWNRLDNLTLGVDGTPRRRDGVAALVTTGNGNGVAVHGTELLVISGGTVASVSTAGTAAVNNQSGRLGWVGVGKTEIRRSTGMQDSCDVATGGGLTCYVWRELDAAATQVSLNVTVVDEVTGAQLISAASLRTSATAFCPRVVWTGDSFIIAYIDAGRLLGRAVVGTAPGVLGGEVAIEPGPGLASLNFDMAAIVNGVGNGALIAFGWTDGVTSVRCVSVAVAAGLPVVAFGPTNLVTEVQLPIANLCGLAVAKVSTALAGIFTYGFGATAMAGVAGVTTNGNSVVQTAATQLSAAITPTVNNPCHIAACAFSGGFAIVTDNQSSWATAALLPVSKITCDATLGTLVTSTLVNSASFAGAATDPAGPKGPYIAGKPFVSNSTLLVPVCVMENYQGAAFSSTGTRVTNNMQNTFFVMDCTSIVAKVVARALYGGYGVAALNNNPPRVSTACSTPALSAGGFAIACTERTLLSFVGGFNVSPTGVVRLTLTPNSTVAPIKGQLGESTYFAGGNIAEYDGAGVSESSFALFPEGISVEVVAGGGAMTAGVHQVVVIAEYVDNMGQRHQSSPSLAVSATTAANDRLRVRVPSLLLSQKSGIRLVAFITQAAGLSFNRVGTIGLGNMGTANDTTLAFTTLALIDQSDATYASNELLYTQPNQAGTTLPNLAPAPATALGVHQNRLFFDKADQQGQYGYSQQYINNVGLQFNPALGGSVDSSAGAIVGWASMDEKVILFCVNKPFVIYGTGPTPSGGFSNYTDPQEVSADVGCVDARSILKMPHGIVFKSQKGWYMLGRDLIVRYIGAGVEAYNANPVSSAVLLADRQECRFASSSGTQLVYCYELSDPDGDGQWSTSTITAGASPYLIADALWWGTGGYYVSVSLTQGLNKDTAGVYLDVPGTSATAAAIVTTARTSFLHPGPLESFQRVRWLYMTGSGTINAGTSSPTTRIVVDFDDAYGEVAPGSYHFDVVWGSSAGLSPVAGMPIDFRTKLRRQKCKSVAFTIIDTPTWTGAANANAGINWQALALDVGMKRGLNKLQASQTVG